MMKKIILLGYALIVCTGLMMAQTPAGRTASTIVADVLAQLPTERPAQFNKEMKDLSTTGVEGVKILVQMMSAPGKGDNSRMEYALNGLAVFASNDNTLKPTTEQAFLEALDGANDNETKAFLIRQLAIIGSEASITKLSPLLGDASLSSPAARTIASIGGEPAGKALQMALMRRTAMSPEAQLNIIQALGDVAPVEGTEELLKTLLNTDDVKTKAVVINALSRTGTKTSFKELAACAAAVGYKYDLTDASEAYARLISRVYEQGAEKEALAEAQSLLKNATKAGSQYMRIAAFETILKAQAKKSKTLQAALKDKDKAYRNAALHFASAYTDKAMYTDLFKMLPKAKEEKIDLLNWLGNEAMCPEKKEILQSIETGIEKTGIQTLTQQLENANVEVKQATADALVKIGMIEALPALANLLKSSDSETVDVAKNAFAVFNGDITPTLANALDPASPIGKVAIIQLLALRKANAYFNLVVEQTKSSSEEVQTAAYSALRDVVSDKDFVTLCGMLETVDPAFVNPLQRAVIAAISSLSPKEQTDLVSSRMLQAGDAKKYLYYLVLSTTGDQNAFETIVKGFTQESGPAKDAAFDALRAWRGFEIEIPLYEICTNPAYSAYFDRAIKAYIQLASNPRMTGENRLIYLRKAMEAAKTNEQKNEILKGISRTGTYLALLYAGEFLDVSELKANAAEAVKTIALAHKEYTGENVEALLRKAAPALNSQDADYDRQAIQKHLSEMPKETGFISIFNGKDLTGWKGLVANPIERPKMKPAAMKTAQEKADDVMRAGWAAIDGELVFNGRGDNICTDKMYGDFEMYVDWKLDPAGPEADAGIYLRGTPQVQIWDTARVNVGAQVGSGGLYNNATHLSKPLKVADNRLGEWNSFYIKMVGDRVTVILNGELVVDNIILENFWDRNLPIPSEEQIELQAHGSKVYYRNIYIKEIDRPVPFQLSDQEKKEGYKMLFDGTNMHEWIGNLVDYKLEDGCISIDREQKAQGNVYTKDEYANFIFRFEFQLTPAANNGLGIRTPTTGDAAYVGMEIQILDSEDPVYANLAPYQYHGSVYGVIPAKRGFLKPIGEWNYEEVIADGNRIKVTLNGTVILDGDLKEATKDGGSMDKREHPGLFNKTGHIGFLGHGSAVKFRNIRIKELK